MATNETSINDFTTPKMSTTVHVTTATTKMATATSNMETATSKMASSGFKTMTCNPNMPLEMAEGLPPSAGMIIQLIQNLRVDLKNDFRKDFDTMYRVLENIGQRTEDVEYRMQVQEQSHLDLVNTVKELQKQVNLQAEKMADSEDRSRCNNLRIRGIPDNVETSNLIHYFQKIVKMILPKATDLDLIVDHIHRLPKSATAPKDTIVRLHFFHIKQEILSTVGKSGLPADYKYIKVFQDFSAYTMRRHREFQPFTTELRQREIRYRWGFHSKFHNHFF
ncbi:Hypothetical predicted protein [Pelobates cultripes]|uniref:Uncharacterized protein n=1 Tax=Pelobates cultripes TaxID=61616 RepID=A0AAD1S6J9_PELCU|nr:Hypothetical predicted protein [Pelobates cultripes]